MPLSDILFFFHVYGARGRNRTGTAQSRQILSLMCLPVPPLGQKFYAIEFIADFYCKPALLVGNLIISE